MFPFTVLVLEFFLVTAVCAVPLDDIFARKDVGGWADSYKLSDVLVSERSSGDAGERRGTAVELGQLSVLEGNALSKIGGTAPGENHAAFVELGSDKVGQGGSAPSGDSLWLVY